MALQPLHLGQDNAVSVPLRAHMKAAFLESLQKQRDPVAAPDAPDLYVLYVLGSTLLLISGDRRFPFTGRKSEDLDLAFYSPPSQRRFGQEERRRLEERLIPVMKKTIHDAGLEATTGDGKQIVDDLLFASRFLVGRHFSHGEASDLLMTDRPHLIADIPAHGLSVYFEVDVSYPTHMTVLLPPRETARPDVDGRLRLKRDDWRHFLGKILVRSIRHQGFRYGGNPTSFVPLDLVNAYNIVKADPPAVNLDPRSAQSDIKLMRLLMLVNLAVFRRRIEEIDLSSFDPTPENIAAFRGSLEGIVFPESDLTDERITDILTTFQETIRVIFPESPRGGRTPLHLTEKEAEFFELTHGYRTLPSGGREYPPPDPAIRVDLLDENYREVFSAHPPLREAIRNSPGLAELGREIAERRPSF